MESQEFGPGDQNSSFTPTGLLLLGKGYKKPSTLGNGWKKFRSRTLYHQDILPLERQEDAQQM
jgi:hypothetical protein